MTDQPKKTRGPYNKAPRTEVIYKCICCDYESVVLANYQRHLESPQHVVKAENSRLEMLVQQQIDQIHELKSIREEKNFITKHTTEQSELFQKCIVELETVIITLQQKVNEKDIILQAKDETISALQQAIEVILRQPQKENKEKHIIICK